MSNVATFSKSSAFTVMAYVKFTTADQITRFANIDWKSLNYNKTTPDFIEVPISQMIRYYNSSSNAKSDLFFAKSTNDEDMVILKNTNSYLSVIGKSPIIQLGDNVYYVPFLQFRKMLEASLINIDQLPQDELQRLYEKQILNAVENIQSQNELSFDIANMSGLSNHEYKKFWYQDMNDFTKFVFGRFYFNNILSILANKYLNDFLKAYRDKQAFEVFNSYFVDELSAWEYEHRSYMQGYTGLAPYDNLYNDNLFYNVAERSVDNRIRMHLQNEVFNSEPYFYDWEADKYLYQFSTNPYGSMKHKVVSASHYELEDIVKCE